MEKITSPQQFDQFLANNSQAVVKFYTTWCPDCSRIEKAYDQYTQENASRAGFAELNADEVQEIADRFEVRGIPTFLVFKGGELVDRLYSRDAKSNKQVLDFAEKALQELAAR